MCVHGRYSTVCGHSLYVPLLRQNHCCARLFTDPRSRMPCCGATPNPTTNNPPAQVIYMGYVEDWCDEVNCSMQSFEDFEKSYQELERVYIVNGIKYWMTDPDLLNSPHMEELKHCLVQAYGSAPLDHYPTKDVQIVRHIRDIRSSEYLKPFEITMHHLESLGTYVALHNRTFLNAQEIAMLKRYRREGLAVMDERMKEIERAMSTLSELRAKQEEALLRNSQPLFNFAKNWNAAVSWVASLPSTQKIVSNQSVSVVNYAAHLFGRSIPKNNIKSFRFSREGQGFPGFVLPENLR